MTDLRKFVPTSLKTALRSLLGVTALHHRIEELETRTANARSPHTSVTIKSMVCQYEHFKASWFHRWNQEVHPDAWFRGWNEDVYRKVYPDGALTSASTKLHRKPWEWCAIAEALWERGFLENGKTGLGFAVGTEPLPAVFAKYGVSILATDLAMENPEAAAWRNSNQNAESLESLWKEEILPREQFAKLVRFQHADMKHPEAINETFDFVWSSCALEHLGSLEEGMNFVINSSKLLKPGGIGVHTTEFNVGSNESTLMNGPSVVYRKRDIEELDYRLRQLGMCLEEMDFRAGTAAADRQFDVPPYYAQGTQHIKLLLADQVATSIVFVVYA
jgi:SAM-dependent methyltransferase